MSDSPVGGYILFPSTLAKADLITATLQAMELASEEFEIRLYDEGKYSEEVYPFRTEDSPERALELLVQEEIGMIKGEGGKGAEIYLFEPIVASYSVIVIKVDSVIFYRERFLCHAESFARRWPRLCEQGQAVFGYFCPFEHMFERDYLTEKIMPALQGGDLATLMSTDINWLIYLGPELAQRWRQEHTPFPVSPVVSQEMPSGAHFFRTRPEVFA